MVELLRADSALPPTQRRWLKGFTEPRIEVHVGVSKPGAPDIRYADVLVIEGRPPAGQAPRVETFSFKSRYLALLEDEDQEARLEREAQAALDYYGGKLDILRRSLKQPAVVQRVRLVYEGGELLPEKPESFKEAVNKVKHWEGTFDPEMGVERALTPFLEALEEYAGEWMPDFVKGQRRRKYSRAAVWKALEERRTEVSARCGLIEVPTLFKESPESLTDLDFQFWFEDFPRIVERPLIDQRAVPSVGAYLGQVQVRHLGGEWIPRKKLEETQVRVGQRVWLPFVRAHKYLRSRQSLVDFSLTQLYRVAERYRA